MYDLIKRHYLREEVREEIADYARDRWVGLHCQARDEKGRMLLVRYTEGRRPLTIREKGDVLKALQKYSRLRPRTFYASSNLYWKMEREGDVASLANVKACTPCWDIDNTFDSWRSTITACQEIVSALDKMGVAKSVSVYWSGEGAHVRIHHEAFSPELRSKIHPLDLAFAVVEFIARKVEPKIIEEQVKSEGKLKVENKMDPQRLFTCPLSLHRELDVVCVCIPLNKLSSFDPEWVRPDVYRHSRDWRRFEVGEADELAQRAYEAVGGYPRAVGGRCRRRKYRRVDEAIKSSLSKLLREDHF
ncbi:MAG: hypothetical protein DRJ97_03940 [Thermoprotei archaeon]|nr:MAG: hypothetical protein DRJ97_03940 [Thermoprotei archaeon]